MMKKEGRGRTGGEKERVKWVKGQRCNGRLEIRGVSQTNRENENKELTGCARPTSLVRWISMTSGRSFRRVDEDEGALRNSVVF